MHDASLSLDDIAFFRRLDENSLLPVRVYGMVGCAPINTFCDVARYHGESFTLAYVARLSFEPFAHGFWAHAIAERSRSTRTARWGLGDRACSRTTQTNQVREDC